MVVCEGRSFLFGETDSSGFRLRLTFPKRFLTRFRLGKQARSRESNKNSSAMIDQQ